ncbi:glycoside hydrolase family 36 protein [Xylariaceae sp. FL0594]|nr:glycoside hydrolase family 36 protein [Xylariaceae sp. FL0594]
MGADGKPSDGVFRLHSFPPLGRVTETESHSVLFSVVLEVNDNESQNLWEVCIWHAPDEESLWEETLLTSALESESPVCLYPSNGTRLYYHTSLPIQRTLHFTLKFRSDPTKPWSWARDRLNLDDGLVLSKAGTSYPLREDLADVIHGLNPALKVRSVMSQTPRTQLWTVEAAVGPAGETESAYADLELGHPWGGFVRYLALVRHSQAWLGPRHGRSKFTIDKDALLCSILSHEGKHLVLLAISNVANVMTLLRSSESGPVMVHLRNDSNTNSTGVILAAVGDDCDSAICAALYHARTLMQHASAPNGPVSESSAPYHDDVGAVWMQNWYDGLGYCTWNALGQNLTEDKLLNAVDTLKSHNINISNLIIDDNWQDIDRAGAGQGSYSWKGFEAEPQAFPSGLKHTVSQIRERLPSVEHVAVWHALLGYWGGISPHGDIASKYKTVQLNREGSSRPITVIDKGDVGRFYDDFYRFLDSCGVDGVKTDAQFMVDAWTSAPARRELTNAYLDAWSIASLRHFGGRVISCMSQAPQILFHQQLPQNRPAIPVRNSDDFFPQEPASHPWHIWANAHNALLTQHLNILPDWDMFQTRHEQAAYHTAARCISGGPIYITDEPGQHDMQLIKQMTALTPRGKTVILRPSVLGRTIDAYTGYEEDSLLKIGSYNGKAAIGTPFLGIFNTRPHALTDIVSLGSFPGVLDSQRYIVRSHVRGQTTPVVTEPQSEAARLVVSLDVGGYDILTAYPITEFESETNGKISTASLGLIDKMTGAAAILSSSFELLPTGRIASATRLKALGTLGVYISSLPTMFIERDLMVTIQSQPVPLHTVSVDERDARVLAVDVEAAWKEMGLSSGWGNEVEVKVFFDAEHP